MDGFVMATKKSVSLSVGRGEKLPASKGAGLTEKGRAKYNRETGSNLKAPAPSPKTKADQGRKDSFCARMEGMKKKLTSEKTAKDPNSRINKSLRAWNCAEGGYVNSADGIATKGKTKGTMITMNKGGMPC